MISRTVVYKPLLKIFNHLLIIIILKWLYSRVSSIIYRIRREAHWHLRWVLKDEVYQAGFSKECQRVEHTRNPSTWWANGYCKVSRKILGHNLYHSSSKHLSPKFSQTRNIYYLQPQLYALFNAVIISIGDYTAAPYSQIPLLKPVVCSK